MPALDLRGYMKMVWMRLQYLKLEYLAAGLPVIVPYKDTAFLDKELPEWFLELPNEAGALAREKENIINFVKKMEGCRIPLYDVIPYVGSKYWEAERVKFMEDVLNNS